MKRFGLLLFGLIFTLHTFGQTINIQGGTSFSQLDLQFIGINNDPVYDETLIGYSIFVGIDYLDKQFINLSSNIGIIRKGGKDEIPIVDQNGERTGETIIDKPTLDYLSINTTVDIKYRIKETITPFISIGPRLDYLVSSSKLFDGLKELVDLNSTSVGLLLGGGLKYDISKIQIGLRADYYLEFTKVLDWTNDENGFDGKISVNTFTINLSIGYKLK